MAIKTEAKAKRTTKKGYVYRVRGVKGEKTTITARNTQDAVNKVSRMYPRAKILGVERVSVLDRSMRQLGLIVRGAVCHQARLLVTCFY